MAEEGEGVESYPQHIAEPGSESEPMEETHPDKRVKNSPDWNFDKWVICFHHFQCYLHSLPVSVGNAQGDVTDVDFESCKETGLDLSSIEEEW